MPTIATGLGTLIITGSSGLIGSAFLDHVGENYTEMGFDWKGPPRPAPKTTHLITCDLRSDESVSAALNEVRRLGHGQIASILHLGAYYSFSSESSPLYEQVNVRGTERLLHGLRDFEVEQFLFASTMLVHQPLAKFGAWLQNLVPGVEPFVKPWMIDLSDDHYAFAISRARRFLGWEPRHSLRENLPRMIDELKMDPVGWYRENNLRVKTIPDR